MEGVVLSCIYDAILMVMLHRERLRQIRPTLDGAAIGEKCVRLHALSNHWVFGGRTVHLRFDVETEIRLTAVGPQMNAGTTELVCMQ